jgi:phage-related protein
MNEELKITISASTEKLTSGCKDAAEAIKDIDDEGKKAGDNGEKHFGKIATAIGKVTIAAVTAAASGIGLLAKSAIEGYAEYEQLIGGVDTLFKDSSGTIQGYAADAYKTAGLSANDYMTTITSFSASMLQSLDGDTAAAAEASNQAVIDMADNANKMGTSMESIQNAYQGFAKQNFTMLDNLKLGYGGTQEEMYRLMSDAAKLDETFAKSADFSLDEKGHLHADFADITEAIHIIQTEMGITGTTASEASSTISGSTASMKSAWSNLVVGLADDNADFDSLIDNFVTSATTAMDNILPRLEIALSGIASLIQEMIPVLMELIPPLLNDFLPKILQSAIEIVSALIIGIVEALPTLIETLVAAIPTVIEAIVTAFNLIVEYLPDIIETLVGALPELIPDIIDGVVLMLTTLVENIADIIQPIIDVLPDIIISLIEALMNNLPALIEGLITLIMAIVEAIPEILKALVDATPTIISMIVEGILGCLPQLLAGLVELVAGLVKAIPEIYGLYAEGLINFFKGIWDGICKVFEPLIEWFKDLFNDAWEGIKKAWEAVSQWFSDLWDSICGVFEPVITWFSDLFSDAWDGVCDAFSAVGTFFSEVWEGIKKPFDSVATWFSDIFSKAWEGVKNVFSSGGKIFDGIKEGIASVFSTVVNGIITGINKVIKVPFDAINGMLNTIRDISFLNISPFKGLWKKNPLSVPQIPLLAEGTVVDDATMAVVGEDGAEAVMPLENNLGWLDKLAGMLNERMGGGSDRPIYLQVDGKTFAQISVDSINQLTRQTGNLPLVIA